ncbi:MAG: hypothetical protein ILP16_00980 [Spirochaetales bacterium]|nr:hypothetical protein [Spirochaetales bacterium]
MTLAQAQTTAVEKLQQAFSADRPKVYVEPYDGVLSFKEASQRFKNTPCILVSPLSSSDSQIQLAVYCLSVSTDKNVVSVLDKTIGVLRGLSGTGRIPLQVESRSAYDNDGFKAGLRIWIHMVSWPHLADGSDAVEEPSPVKAAKQRIQALFQEGTVVATTQSEAAQLLLGSSLPFVTVLTGEGSFDTKERRTVIGNNQGSPFMMVSKGQAVWPITIKAYATTESEAQSILWPILPDLPDISSDEYGFNTVVTISGLAEGLNENGACVASVTVSLKVPANMQTGRLKTIREVGVYPAEE